MKLNEANFKLCESYLKEQGSIDTSFIKLLLIVARQRNLMKVFSPVFVLCAVYMMAYQQNLVLSLVFSFLAVFITADIYVSHKKLHTLYNKIKSNVGESDFNKMEFYVEAHQEEAKTLLKNLLSFNRMTSEMKEKVKH